MTSHSIPGHEHESAFARGREAWPELALAPEAFAAWRAARPLASNDHVADHVLACACIARVPGALEAFSERYLDHVDRYLGRLATDASVVDEVRQRLAIRLFVGEDERGPRLVDYGGRGSLEGWVRVAASRLALEHRRRERASSSGQAHDDLSHRLADGRDPELSHIKARYRGDFARALGGAVTDLPPSERLLLRLHYVDAMTTSAMAALFQVSRATIVRRIGDARTALHERLLTRVATELGVSSREYHELLALVRSTLDVSLARLLREA